MAYIYVITNKINGNQYVGKTVESLNERWENHVYEKDKRRAEKRPLYDAFNKYGVENFKIEQLEECSIDILSDRERYWIKKLDTYNNGYNATMGGDGSLLYDYKILSDKYKELQNLNETAKFFNCDVNTIKRACKEYNVEILSFKEVSRNKNGKKVAMIDKNTGDILKIFKTVGLAAEYLGDRKKNSHIFHVCNGQRKTAYGYHWKYVE